MSLFEKLKDLPFESKGKVLDVSFDSAHQISVLTDRVWTEEACLLFLLPNLTIEKISVDDVDKRLLYFTVKEELKHYLGLSIVHPFLETFSLPLKVEYLHTEMFRAHYHYDGTLGVFYQKEQSLFKLWAPTALKVELLFVEENRVFSMIKEKRGLWQFSYEGDALSVAYLYRLYFQDGSINESLDPYGKASLANHRASVVLDFEHLRPDNWRKERMPAFSSPTDAVFYEVHLRDLTIGLDNGIQHKGKFLGLTEKNTKTSKGADSGLAYLKKLGVTHLQFLPLFDFATVDETKDLTFGKQYNWGYDPVQYNVPEGSYATRPDLPESRILEMKEMIETLHEEGFYVIMDVVYNHVYEVEKSSLHQTVPGYYFRYDEKRRLHNGTGVGNETASEQSMYRKYMLDSLLYFVEHYRVDGFRFDLMGIHDVETMNEIRKALDEIDPSMLIIGEGWDMGNHPKGIQKAHQYNASLMPRIAFFNDVFRDAVKGDNFELERRGYVSSEKKHEFPWLIYNSLQSQYVVPYQSPVQNVLYNEAHDNATLYDKLKISLPQENEKNIMLRQLHATALQMLGHGISFVHAGQEILRTKKGEHNSYNAPDPINVFDYDRQLVYPEALEYFQKLVRFRKEHKAFTQGQFEDIRKKRKYLQIEEDALVFFCENYLVISNMKDHTASFEVPKDHYVCLLKGLQFFENGKSEIHEKIEVPALSLAIYLKVKA